VTRLAGTSIRIAVDLRKDDRLRATFKEDGRFCSAQQYKSIDAQGHVVYSDRPETSTAQKAIVNVDRPDAKEAARMGKEQEILKAEEIQRDRQKLIDDAKKAQQDHAKQVQCDAARNHYYALKDARRIYDRDADGNRVYYTDAEANAKREDARQAMTAACEM
jgi:hypothetical protein